MGRIELSILVGTDLQAALPALSNLRIEVFREFPYLYDGTLNYETAYLAKFAEAKDAIIVVAREDETIVGCATGSALSAHHEAFAVPFLTRDDDIETIFYFGESVLKAQFRGRGLGHAFFDYREDHARRSGYRSSTFCAVIRPDHHPLRPSNYRPLNEFWKKRGYSPIPDMVATFRWKDIDQVEETGHAMQFWMKALT